MPRQTDPRAPICVGPRGFCKKPEAYREKKTGRYFCVEHAIGHDVEPIDVGRR